MLPLYSIILYYFIYYFKFIMNMHKENFFISNNHNQNYTNYKSISYYITFFLYIVNVIYNQIKFIITTIFISNYKNWIILLILTLLTLIIETIYRDYLYKITPSFITLLQSYFHFLHYYFILVSFLSSSAIPILIIVLFFTSETYISFIFLKIFIFSIYFSSLLKIIHNQNRPFWENQIKSYECQIGFGNPSGHSCLGFSFYIGLYLYLKSLSMINAKIKKGSWFFLIFLISIPISRIYLGQHSLNQVIFGCCLGICIVFYVFFCLNMNLTYNENNNDINTQYTDLSIINNDLLTYSQYESPLNDDKFSNRRSLLYTLYTGNITISLLFIIKYLFLLLILIFAYMNKVENIEKVKKTELMSIYNIIVNISICKKNIKIFEYKSFYNEAIYQGLSIVILFSSFISLILVNRALSIKKVYFLIKKTTYLQKIILFIILMTILLIYYLISFYYLINIKNFLWYLLLNYVVIYIFIGIGLYFLLPLLADYCFPEKNEHYIIL